MGTELTPTSQSQSPLVSLGIPARMIRAIQRVESNGNPLAVRFEPHLFIRDTGLKVPYTGPGPSKVRAETDRSAFDRAFALNPQVAVEDSSFGLYQVMGSHLLALFPEPNLAVSMFMANPQKVSEELLVSWFNANPKAKRAARNLDFYGLARLYNGPLRVAAYGQALRKAYGL